MPYKLVNNFFNSIFSSGNNEKMKQMFISTSVTDLNSIVYKNYKKRHKYISSLGKIIDNLDFKKTDIENKLRGVNYGCHEEKVYR